MFLIIAFLLDVVAAVYGFKTAKSNVRNGVMWAVLVLLIGISVQLVIPFFIVIILASVSAIGGTIDLASTAAKIGTAGGILYI